MTAAALLVAAYLCLPTFRPAAYRLPEIAGNVSEPVGKRKVAVWWYRTSQWVRARVRALAKDGRIAPALLLDAAAALDVMAACLSAGLPLSQAMVAAADGVSPELAEPLQRCSARLSVGARSAWEALSGTPALAPLATAGRRAAESGTSLADALADTATTYREQAHDAAQAVAERAGVLIAGPLALCFLPAFVVLGLIPTIAGLADDMFAGMVP